MPRFLSNRSCRISPGPHRPFARRRQWDRSTCGRFRLTFALWTVAAGLNLAAAEHLNGFDLSNALIPPEAVRSGGPPRDGIPAIDRPSFDPASRPAPHLRDDDLVLSLALGSESRAYPLRILAWHEIVNDVIQGRPIAVTYCPLCGTAMVFDRRVGERVLDFGVSGLLYQSDVLIYDRQTESLWSQLAMKAVAGPLAGRSLVWLPSEHLTWKAWRQLHPDGRVLSTRTGFRRDYRRNPYERYAAGPRPMFLVPEHRTELPKKAWVLGVLVNGRAQCYPLEALEKQERIQDTVGGVPLEVSYDPETRRARVKRMPDGEPLPSVTAYWFAWQAFYPDTGLWRATE